MSLKTGAFERDGSLMAVRCAILDDYQNVVLKIADWSKVKGDVEFKVFTEHLGGPDDPVCQRATSDFCIYPRDRASHLVKRRS